MLVKRGLSPFSVYPVCDVCYLSGKPATIQVGRWMVHPHCLDKNLETLKLPPLNYHLLGKTDARHAPSLITRMATRLKQQARRQLIRLNLRDVMDGLNRYDYVLDRAPAEPNNFGASGRSFDTTTIDRMRAWAQQEVLT